mgnify:CR=1 FL=1
MNEVNELFTKENVEKIYAHKLGKNKRNSARMGAKTARMAEKWGKVVPIRIKLPPRGSWHAVRRD